MALDGIDGMRLLVISLFSLAACVTSFERTEDDPDDPPITNDPPSDDGGPVVAPSNEHYQAARAGAPALAEPSGDTVVVDLASCGHGFLHAWLPLGSGWLLVHPDGDHCELWLGGETENPLYDGEPTQYCSFLRRGTVTIEMGNGGPFYIDSPRCIAL